MQKISRLKALLLVLIVTISGVVAMHSTFAASTGQIYISPATTNVNVNNNLTVGIRINPGTAVNGVQFTLNYDPAQLKFASLDTSSSAFSTQLQQTTSAGTVKIARGQLGGSVS